MKERWRRLACLPFLLATGPAWAHSPIPGIEGFYVGLIHPFSTPSQAVLMLGLGLVVGGYASNKAGWLWLIFLAGSFAGLIVAAGFQAADTMMYAVAVAACSVAALLPSKTLLLAVALIAAGAFLIGDASVPDEGPMRDRLFTMSGSMVGANVGLLYLFGVCLLIRERFTRHWVGIAFRVAAAWLGAISLLMLALGFADPTMSA